MIVKVWSPKVTVPVREMVGFTGTRIVTVVGPLATLLVKILIQLTLVLIEKSQLAAALIVTSKTFPFVGTRMSAIDGVKVQTVGFCRA